MFIIRPWGLFRGCKSDLLRDVLVVSVVCLCWVSGIHSTFFSVNDLGSSINLGRRNPNSSHPCHPCAPLLRLGCVSLSRLRALKRWKQKLVAMSQSCWRWGFKTAAGLKGVDLKQPTQRHLLELDCQRRTRSYLPSIFCIQYSLMFLSRISNLVFLPFKRHRKSLLICWISLSGTAGADQNATSEKRLGRRLASEFFMWYSFLSSFVSPMTIFAKQAAIFLGCDSTGWLTTLQYIGRWGTLKRRASLWGLVTSNSHRCTALMPVNPTASLWNTLCMTLINTTLYSNTMNYAHIDADSKLADLLVWKWSIHVSQLWGPNLVPSIDDSC